MSFKTASNCSGYSGFVVRPYVVLAILQSHSSLLFQALSQMLKNFRLVFGVCSVPLLQSRKSKVCFYPLLHSLGLMIYLVGDLGYCTSGSFQFGIYFPPLNSVKLGTQRVWRRVFQRVLQLRRDCGLYPKRRTQLVPVVALVSQAPQLLVPQRRSLHLQYLVLL